MERLCKMLCSVHTNLETKVNNPLQKNNEVALSPKEDAFSSPNDLSNNRLSTV